MEESRIRELAAAEGFAAAAVIPVNELVFVPEYRKYCEENSCGNYGANYGCPPDCGTPEVMKARVLAHTHAAVFQTRTQVRDFMDDREMKKLKKRHTEMTWKLLEKLKQEGMDQNGFPIMCGPCGICPVCHKTEETPCVCPEKMASCLSAYCIDAGKMAESCGMEIQWDGNIVSFFSLYIYHDKRMNE